MKWEIVIPILFKNEIDIRLHRIYAVNYIPYYFYDFLGKKTFSFISVEVM